VKAYFFRSDGASERIGIAKSEKILVEDKGGHVRRCNVRVVGGRLVREISLPAARRLAPWRL
jgi:hypothetical protein